MPASTASSGGFMTWIATYGSMIGFFVQIFFYIIVAAAAAWAAVTFSRYVKFMTSDEPVAAEPSDTVKVDEFVE